MAEAPEKLAAVLPDHAPGQGDRSTGAGVLPLSQLAQPTTGPVLRMLADGAGDQDRKVRVFQFHSRHHAKLGELLREAVRVGGVHLAPDLPDVHPGGTVAADHDGSPLWPSLQKRQWAEYRPRPDRRLQRTSTTSRMPVRSSPSMAMSMNEGMHTSSKPPGAT